jgi:hypothetical protein
MWNSAWAGFGPRPRTTVLAQRPIPTQGASAEVRIDRGHHTRMCSGQHSGALAVGAAVAS